MKFGLPLAAGLALVDECLDAGHGLGAGRGAAGAGDDDRPAAGEVGAVAGKGADGIKAVVIAICGKERNVGNVAHFIGGDAGSCLPGRLGVALRRRSAGIERGAAGSAASGDDGLGGLIGGIASIGQVVAEEVVPGLLGDGLLEGD